MLTTFVDFELAVGLALATAVAALLAGRLSGSTIKGLELVDTAFFTVLAIIGALASDRVSDWLTTWAAEFSNIVLVVIAVGSMLIRHPFTLSYAKERVPPSVWNAPRFLRTNYIITGAWAAAFLVAAVSGLIGDAVLDDSNNVWTGWIIQIAVLIVAIQFTVWYPRVVQARRARRPASLPTPRRRSASC